MRLFLQDGPARIQILSRSQLREFRDPAQAREFLRPLWTSPGNRIAARNAAGAGAQRLSDDELLDALALRMVSEGLQVVTCAESYLAAIQGTFTATSAAASTSAAGAAAQQQSETTTPLQDEEAAKEEQATAPGADEKHFIEIELVDDEGKPVANERWFVELPDGSTKSGSTDANGYARIDGVDPGTAKISFPDMDKTAYEPGGGS
jgi:hypothetical protein